MSQQERNTQNGQAEQGRQNMTGRTGLLGKDCRTRRRERNLFTDVAKICSGMLAALISFSCRQCGITPEFQEKLRNKFSAVFDCQYLSQWQCFIFNFYTCMTSNLVF
jgi:hypothetical protein